MKLLRAVSLSLALCGAALVAHADEFSFTFSGPGVTGSGSLEATADASDPGAFYVTDGSATINGSAWAITGGNADPGTYQTTTVNSYGWVFQYNNVLYDPAPYLDNYGLLFTNGSDTSNLYYTSGSYYFLPSGADLNASSGAGIAVTMTVAPVPEPASIVYSGTALVAMAAMMAVEMRRRRLASDSI